MTFLISGIRTCGIIGFLQVTFGNAENKPNSKHLELNFE
jgi:hypothetical protein